MDSKAGFDKRSEFLIFGKPAIEEEDIQEVIDTLRSGWIGTGPKTSQFENAIQTLLGVKHTIAVNSCTAALSLALEIAGVGDGDEVITTPLTFAATANVIVHRGARPVFADVDRATGNISPNEIEKRITSKTKAIIPVHLAGCPCDMDAIMELANLHNLIVIEDAAHALEAIYKGRKIGAIGDFGAFSFYPTKSITTGEGGILSTNNDKWAKQAKVLRLHGISADAWKRYSNSGYSSYEVEYPGYKYNMTDIQAALGLHQIERLERNLKHREHIWQLYDEGLKHIHGLTLPPLFDEVNSVHARHLYTIMVDEHDAGISRNDLTMRLKEANIGTGIHYTALHEQKFYREKFGYGSDDYPNAKWISDRTLSLPLTASMTLADAEDVITVIDWIITR